VRRLLDHAQQGKHPRSTAGLRETGQLVQFAARGAAVDRHRRGRHALKEGIHFAGRHQRGGGVHQHDVAPRAALAGKNGLGDFEVAGVAAALEIGGGGAVDGEILGLERAPFHAALADFECQRGTGGGDFVQAVRAVDHEAALQTQRCQRRGDQSGRFFRRGAGDLRSGAGWVGERPQQVEERPHFEIDAHRGGVLEWSGKREKPWFEADPVALHMHERVSTQAILRVLAREDIQRDLFADPQHDYAKAVQFYQHDMDWANRMILGDSLQVMASLARREDLAGRVQMIYLDPPYGIS
jgi:hypothetical protein